MSGADKISAHDAWNAIAHLKAVTSTVRKHGAPTMMVDTNLLSIALTLAQGTAEAETRGRQWAVDRLRAEADRRRAAEEYFTWRSFDACADLLESAMKEESSDG